MPFCGKCGSKVNDMDMFCARCGAPVNVSTGESNEGDNSKARAGKCPNCGAVIVNPFQTNCSFCGYIFVKDNSGSTVADLAKKLSEVEAQVKATNTYGYMNIYSLDSETSRIKANLISTFAIPNNMEDILEFMILSSSNIIPSYLSKTNNFGMDNDPQIQNLLLVQNAWISKMEQAYNKAKLSFGSDPFFTEVERLYNGKMLALEKEVKRKKRIRIIVISSLIAAIIATIIFLIWVESV